MIITQFFNTISMTNSLSAKQTLNKCFAKTDAPSVHLISQPIVLL